MSPAIHLNDTGNQADRHDRFYRIAEVYSLDVNPPIGEGDLLPRFVSVRMTMGAFNREVPRTPANMDYYFSTSHGSKGDELSEFLSDLSIQVWDGWIPWASFDLDEGRLLNVYYGTPQLTEEGEAEVIDVLDERESTRLSEEELRRVVIS